MTRHHRIGVLAAVWLAVAGIFTMALTGDWVKIWGALGIPAAFPSFADLRSITGGLESSRLGLDPLIQNPRDPWTRPMNYPRIWLHLFGVLGIDDANLHLVGLALSAVYLACISVLLWRTKDALLAGTICACVLSGASLLAMERGNNDLLIFALVFFAVVSRSLLASASALGTAIVLKLYPLAAIVDLVTDEDRRRRQASWLLVAVGILVAYSSYDDLRLIARSTPTSFGRAYGVLSMHAGCGEISSRFPSLSRLCGDWLMLPVALVACAVLAIAHRAWTRPMPLASRHARGEDADLFVAFAAIYVATFFTGANWAYRLIVLIPALPFMCALARLKPGKGWGWIGMGLVLVAMNVGAIGTTLWIYVSHVAQTSLAFICWYLLVTVCRRRLGPLSGLAHRPS